VTAGTVFQFSVMTDTRPSGLVREQCCDFYRVIATTRGAFTKRLASELETRYSKRSDAGAVFVNLY
jgi:hypothetical protein